MYVQRYLGSNKTLSKVEYSCL